MKASDYKQDANLAKEKLDAVSKSFCLAKWNQVSLHLPTGLTNSCYHPPLHEIDAAALTDNPAALHNTQHKLEQRSKMLQGEKPTECSYCWNMEDAGEMSDRHYRSGEPWAMQDFDTIVQDPLNTKHLLDIKFKITEHIKLLNYFNQNAQKIKIDIKQLLNTQKTNYNKYFEETYTPSR